MMMMMIHIKIDWFIYNVFFFHLKFYYWEITNSAIKCKQNSCSYITLNSWYFYSRFGVIFVFWIDVQVCIEVDKRKFGKSIRQTAKSISKMPALKLIVYQIFSSHFVSEIIDFFPTRWDSVCATLFLLFYFIHTLIQSVNVMFFVVVVVAGEFVVRQWLNNSHSDFRCLARSRLRFVLCLCDEIFIPKRIRWDSV